MEKLILSEEILKEFKVENVYSKDEKSYETCRYFLEKDILKIIGQNEFDILNKTVYIECCNQKDKHEIRFYTCGNCYIISLIGDIITILNNRRVVVAQIKPGEKGEITNYRVVTKDGKLEKMVTERLRGSVPKVATVSNGITKEEFKKMSLVQQAELARKDKDLYLELSKN